MRCNLRDFPDKVIHDPDFLHLLAVHLLNLADQNPADEPVQHRLVQFFNGGIVKDKAARLRGANDNFLITVRLSGSFVPLVTVLFVAERG